MIGVSIGLPKQRNNVRTRTGENFMILQEKARCVRCSTLFDIGQDSDSKHHLLRCNRCGREKIVRAKEFVKFFRQIQENFTDSSTLPAYAENLPKMPNTDTPPINDKKYRFMVEYRSGFCVCGSVFKFSGKPRCPRCRSSVYRIEPSLFSTELLTM